MNAILRRLHKLEEKVAPKQNERDRRLAGVIRELRCRRLSRERGVPYEQVFQQSVIESQALMEGYRGDGTIADTMRFVRRRKPELSAAARSSTEPVGAIR